MFPRIEGTTPNEFQGHKKVTRAFNLFHLFIISLACFDVRD